MCKFLAQYLLYDGKFLHPTTLRNLKRNEVKQLDFFFRRSEVQGQWRAGVGHQRGAQRGASFVSPFWRLARCGVRATGGNWQSGCAFNAFSTECIAHAIANEGMGLESLYHFFSTT